MPLTDKGIRPGSKIPAFTLQTATGGTMSSNELLGTPVLLYFLRGTW